MAQLALEAGSPGEAQQRAREGYAEERVHRPAHQGPQPAAARERQEGAPPPTRRRLPRLEKEADAAPTGAKNVGVGLAYLGYGQYDKAADEFSKGLSKGGVKDEAQARLLLGIAQLKAGHKDDAVKTFKAVKGDPALERLANLWSLHAKQA